MIQDNAEMMAPPEIEEEDKDSDDGEPVDASMVALAKKKSLRMAAASLTGVKPGAKGLGDLLGG